MNAQKLSRLIRKQPFRPFAVRLSNGQVYRFDTPEQLGAPPKLQVLFHFTEDDFTMIDTSNITEVVERLPRK